MNNPLIPPPGDTAVAKPKQVQQNPLIAAAQGQRPKSNPLIASPTKRAHPLIPNAEPPHETSNLEAVANVLSLPGSSVVDALAGENPLDQWATPTKSINRTTGQELLRKHDLLDDNDSWKDAVAGFAVDVALDPLTYAGFGTLSKGGKALSKSGVLKGTTAADRLTDATRTTVKQVLNASDDPEAAMKAFEMAGGKAHQLEEPIKHVVSLAGHDLAKPLAPVVDAASDAIRASAPMRHLRSMFDPRVMNTTSEASQKIAEHRSEALSDVLANVGSKFAPIVQANDLASARAILGDVAREAEQSGLEVSKFQPWAEANDVSSALANAERLTKASAMSHASSELLGLSARTDANGISMADAVRRLGVDTPQARSAIEDWAGKPFDTLHVSPDIVDDAERMLKPVIDPETIGGVRKAVEGFTRLFKANATLPWPSFAVRNLIGGQMMNTLMGANRIQDLADDLTTAWKLQTGKTPKHLSSQIPDYAGLSPEKAAQQMREEIFSHNIVGDWQPGAADISKYKPDAASRMPGANPLQAKAKPTVIESLNPMVPSKFAPTRIGTDVASLVESANRLGGYIGLRRLGYSPSMAAKRILALQGDYNSATKAEQTLRNVIPFYQFSKAMLGLTADELMHRPGGRLGVAIKASAASDRNSSKPRNEASLKIGDTRYSGFGEMHKDAVDALGALMKGDTRALARQAGDKLSPLLKFPIEQATGYDLHSGRPLDKMPPAVEELLGAPIGTTGEHLARSSPAARYLSEAQRIQKKRENALLKFATGVTSGP